MGKERLPTISTTMMIYDKLADYPIMADVIRNRMRQELYHQGIISEAEFETLVEQQANDSRQREGTHDPFRPEATNLWIERKARIRNHLTDVYFSHKLSILRFNDIVVEVLHNQPQPEQVRDLPFNPETANRPELFAQGQIYEAMPPLEQEKFIHHLQEIKVVLIKEMISDQLPYIGIAKHIFSIADLKNVDERLIGGGRIGGKAAGMLLAYKILQQRSPEIGGDISQQVSIADSYFLGTDVIYEFRRLNNLDRFMNEKYRTLDKIKTDHPQVIESHLQGRFPVLIEERLHEIMHQIGHLPVIVRSSSLLEDNFGYAFAGKYQSIFCTNQGSSEENFAELAAAIKRVYASTLNPDAIVYRQHHGLIDYDERMAVLIQVVHGQPHGRYFFPTLAGVGYSRNPFRWSPKIRREEGFLRLVWGMGTRAVDRVSRDYPRMIALSNPELRPETTAKAIRQYSQHYIDVLDLTENQEKTLPVSTILNPKYPALRYVASVYKDDYLQNILSPTALSEDDELVLTLDYVIKDRKFVRLMRTALSRLEQVYRAPVDVEFAIDIIPSYPYPDYRLIMLQCRPLTQREESEGAVIPANLPAESLLFRTYDLVPDGKVEGIQYVVFVNPVVYRQIAQPTTKLELGRAIGRLNKQMEKEKFILVGPGRWGSSNLELGVRVGYADIYNTKVLIEMSVADGDDYPELSYGTHFFQDLVEGDIYSLPLHLQNPRSSFNWKLLENSPNHLAQFSPADAGLSDYLTVIDIRDIAPNKRLNILMNSTNEEAVGYLADGKWSVSDKHGSLSNF